MGVDEYLRPCTVVVKGIYIWDTHVTDCIVDVRNLYCRFIRHLRLFIARRALVQNLALDARRYHSSATTNNITIGDRRLSAKTSCFSKLSRRVSFLT